MSLGLDPARAADPARYAVGGAVPRHALRPADRDEVAEALRAAARDGLGVLPWGGGAGLALEPAPPRYDVALDMTGLDRVIVYEPEDMTLTAEAGCTLAKLRAMLAARGQELPLEGAHAARATFGGVLAANASGPRRLRFGSPRDRVLGARYALGDGTLARTGGRVVKNVAGYALHRLLCGSRGGLAVIVEASVKLATAPARRVALVFGVSDRELAEPARWVALPRLEPAFVTVLGRDAAARLAGRDGPPDADSRFRVIVGLEDDAAWVDAQAARVVEQLGPPVDRLEGAEVVTLAERLADLEAHAPRLAFASAHNSPAALAPLLDRAAAAGLVFHAPAGRLHLFPAAAAAQEVVETAQAHGFSLIEAQGAGAPAAPLPPHSATVALRARIRAALDPGGRFATGERWAAGI